MLKRIIYKYDEDNKVVSCSLCEADFPYSGIDYEDNIQTHDFMNLKCSLKKHFKTQKHVRKEIKAKKDIEEDKKLQSRNQLAGLNVGRLAYANIKL